MQYEELILAFTMRIYKKSYQEIVNKLGYSKQHIQQSLLQSIGALNTETVKQIRLNATQDLTTNYKIKKSKWDFDVKITELKEGTKIQIIDAGNGARIATGCFGEITTQLATNGLYDDTKGVNILVTEGRYKDKIFRVSENAIYELDIFQLYD